MHRVFAFLQFIVFGMMATFSSNFNVFSGLMKDASENLNPGNFQLSNPKIDSIFASSLTRHKLPVLNARGISITMACSRMLLLIQYSVGKFFFEITNIYELSVINHSALSFKQEHQVQSVPTQYHHPHVYAPAIVHSLPHHTWRYWLQSNTRRERRKNFPLVRPYDYRNSLEFLYRQQS